MTPGSAWRSSPSQTWPGCARCATWSRRWPGSRERRPEMDQTWAQIAATPLENEHVLLRPVRPEDRASWHAIAMDPAIWRYFVLRIATDAAFDAYFDLGLADQAAGRRVVYSITDKGSGAAAGSMSFCNMAQPDGRLEIGWSWLGRDFQGAGIHRGAKFLMMGHAL